MFRRGYDMPTFSNLGLSVHLRGDHLCPYGDRCGTLGPSLWGMVSLLTTLSVSALLLST